MIIYTMIQKINTIPGPAAAAAAAADLWDPELKIPVNFGDPNAGFR